MNTQTIRQQLIQEIAELPSEALLELKQFIDYLRYKSSQPNSATKLNADESLPQLMSQSAEISQPERPLYETLSPQELSEAFLNWAEAHHRNLPPLSDYAVSRENIYSDEEL